MSLKTILGAVLAPAARLAGKGEGLRRLWAHARLASMITGRLDASVVVLGVPEIRGTGRISPGRNLFLYRELYLETEADGAIEIGDNVVISRGAHIVSFASVKIGANCMIGEYTSIRDANHRLVPGVAVRDSGHDAKAIELGRNVWIGRGVTILPGVHIGDDAVVGANAVVTRSVPASAIVAGVPAKPIRQEAATA